jgi:hypothetical protein
MSFRYDNFSCISNLIFTNWNFDFKKRHQSALGIPMEFMAGLHNHIQYNYSYGGRCLHR